MIRVVLQQPRQIIPFNEPAANLSVLNRPLSRWHHEMLARYGEETLPVEDFYHVPKQAEEMLVYAENLWFNESFVTTFVEQARKRRKAVRAAFRMDDEAFLQQGLRALVRGFERRGDLYYVPLWYFPEGLVEQVEPLLISSEAQYVTSPHLLAQIGQRTVTFWVPERIATTIDTWVNLLFANVIFELFADWVQADVRGQKRSGLAALGQLLGGKPAQYGAGSIKIGEKCRIDPAAVLIGPLTIGDNVTIGPGCVVSNCAIGDNVTLTHGSQALMSVIGNGCFLPMGASLSYSVLMEGTVVAQNATVEMSVIGRDSSIGAGTVLADVNLLSVPMRTEVDRHLVEIDLPVLGACVGHHCQLGAGLIVYPGRTIESDVVLIPTPSRRVIMKNISYEESDHHATRFGATYQRLYPRVGEKEW